MPVPGPGGVFPLVQCFVVSRDAAVVSLVFTECVHALCCGVCWVRLKISRFFLPLSLLCFYIGFDMILYTWNSIYWYE